MASQTPVFIHDENLHIHGGKGAGELKSGLPRTKSVKPGLQEHKALRDLSNAKQTQAPGPSKATAVLKETSALKSGASKVKKAAVKGSALMDQQLDKYREWAKEGIDYAVFMGNDTLKLKEQQMEERVRKEVEMVKSAISNWAASAYDLRMPKIAEDTEDDPKLELEPEIHLGRNSGIEDDLDDLPEDDLLFSFPDITYESTQREEYEFTVKEEYA